jgi:hypothetical protein
MDKKVFWEAFVIAVFIFASGVFLGYLLEQSRTENILSLYQQSELDLVDYKVLNNMLDIDVIECRVLQESFIKFTERVYNEARTLEKYEGSNQLSDAIKLQHKKYDLLRAYLFIDFMKLRDKCSSNLSIYVYFYNYDTQDLGEKAEQDIFSNKLWEIKNSRGSDIILLPMAVNLNISSINAIMAMNKIEKIPAIIIDNKIRVESLEDLNNLSV